MKQPFKALAFIIFSQLTSCAVLFPCREIKPLLTLADETKKWIPYALGDRLIFDSDLGQDTLEVTFYSESIGEYIWGDECPSGEMETISARLTSKLFAD